MSVTVAVWLCGVSGLTGLGFGLYAHCLSDVGVGMSDSWSFFLAHVFSSGSSAEVCEGNETIR